MEIFVPTAPAGESLVDDLLKRLTDRFGGATAFSRAPAKGRWSDGAKQEADDVIVIETMCETLDVAYWRALKAELESTLRQEEILIRASKIATI